MTDYKTKIKFEQHLDTSVPEPEKLAQKTLFSGEGSFYPDSQSGVNSELSDEKLNIEPMIRPKKQKWIGVTLVTGFMGLIGWQAIDTLYGAYLSQDWLTLGWSGFVGCLAGLGGFKLARELFVLRRLKKHFSTQVMAETILKEDGIGKAESFCRSLNINSNDNEELNLAVESWNSKLDPVYNDKEVFELYDSIVIRKQDQQAINIISKYSAHSAVMVALSPLAIADMFLVAWRSLKMLEELANTYQIELGYWSRLRLLKLVLVNMAFAGATELVIDTGMDILTTNLLQKLSARAGQGVGIGFMTARLGIQAMKLMRPLPWLTDQKTSLSSVRKNIVNNVFKVMDKMQ
ncbi:YcjF family protein [Vibrio salinus]|uniref:YcjF family protein n=1 Tax=Vibrio salinus TaxID=2899784 RepID=UPI001E2FBF0B|nr:TIGR01620 family protein [Vibrio salinus]MCE0492453.1 YcjF family protein [Vibrio salinus]